MEPLPTPRLRVRRFAETDLEGFLAFQSLPEVRRHMEGEPMGDDRAARYLMEQALLPEREPGRWHGYAVEHLADARLIGEVGAYLQKEPDGEGDVGFQFHPAYQGKGYAREATEALIRRLFLGLGLLRITSGCHSQNVASFRLMERLGMRRARQTDGKVGYELTREEWLAQAGEVG